MNTPICDFVREYAKKDGLRLHMPGHKGKDLLGLEKLDLTEIDGADVLYSATGIIKESLDNASALFGTAKTVYSTEGSSLCIRAMLYLVKQHAKAMGRRPVIAAARNVHKVFMTACALLDIDILWLYPKDGKNILACCITAQQLDTFLNDAKEKPTAVYVTSPDYLGNISDIKGLSSVCDNHGCLLCVDNAHGAYLNFLEENIHPIHLGAHICCDSAHKTLPVLTGGAYLHFSEKCPESLVSQAQDALSLFASTSPSYLILLSLDKANEYLCDNYKQKLSLFLKEVDALKSCLSQNGFVLVGSESLKITLATKSYGYTGVEFAEILKKNNAVCEFYDKDFVVMMLTPEIGKEGLEKIKKILSSVPKKAAVCDLPPCVPGGEKVLSVSEALFSLYEELAVSECEGRILADAAVSCPPAIPIAVCGERITKETINCFKYYSVETIKVVK